MDRIEALVQALQSEVRALKADLARLSAAGSGKVNASAVAGVIPTGNGGTGNTAGAPADGTVTAAKIGAGAISDTHINAAAAIAWSKVSKSGAAPSDVGAAAASHTHGASDITSGTVATARLGSGTASSSTYLRGDQTWATIAGSGGDADDVTYDPTASGLAATDVQAAIDELAAAGAGLLVRLSETVLASSAATISASIPSGYRIVLAVLSHARSTAASTGMNVYARLNSDNGANYQYGGSYAGSAAGNVGSGGQTEALVGFCSGASNTSGEGGFVEIELRFPDDTSWRKVLRCSGYRSGDNVFYSGAARWASTAAATSLELFPQSGSWDVGTTLTLYGLA